MPTLKVEIIDTDALASIRRSVLIAYLQDANWQYLGKYRTGTTYSIDCGACGHMHECGIPGTEAEVGYAREMRSNIQIIAHVEARSELAVFDDLRYMMPSPAGTYPEPWDGWVCFHCGTRFREYKVALEHFGPTPDHVAACLTHGHGGM